MLKHIPEKFLSLKFVVNLSDVFFQGPCLLLLGNVIYGQSLWALKG